MQVLVRDNNVDQALRALKKKLQREGVFREMKMRTAFEKPSERRVREKAARKWGKTLRRLLEARARQGLHRLVVVVSGCPELSQLRMCRLVVLVEDLTRDRARDWRRRALGESGFWERVEREGCHLDTGHH